MTYVKWYQNERDQAWQTPPELFDPLHAEFSFDLDGAAGTDNALLPEASTPDHPVSWAGRKVFCNPPWSNIAPFVEQAVEAKTAVLLVPARTNARWFHRALELGASVRFFPKRPKFHRGGQIKWNSPVDCLLLVWA